MGMRWVVVYLMGYDVVDFLCLDIFPLVLGHVDVVTLNPVTSFEIPASSKVHLCTFCIGFPLILVAT
ncbi:hypothetical protein F4810DRAFT_667767 [Camillea tinctor]|nr:hypothetical protein F4810DRAFT_667767 [Camillea tinctor]